MGEKKMETEEEEDVELVHTSRSFSKPSWLLFTIAEVEERMNMLTTNILEEDNATETFAERAESYYLRRPQLLSLLRQLHNGYLCLADRYCQTLAKHHRSQHSPFWTPPSHSNSDNTTFDLDSEVESCLSYQMSVITPTAQPKVDADTIVAELVMKTVEYEIIVDELMTEEWRRGEALKKIELQKSLLDVLESERQILLHENARLTYTAAELVEENKGLAAESAFMKMKAGELARCVLRTRDDYRVSMLNRKIEDLQGQIYGLEKRNKECNEQLIRLEGEKKSKIRKKKKKMYSWSWSKGEVTLEDCFQLDQGTVDGSISTNSTDNGTTSSTFTNSSATTVSEVMTLKGCSSSGGGGSGRRVLKMWDRVKNFDVFNCGPHLHSTF